MKVWQFSEQAYHPAFDVPGAMRVTLPSTSLRSGGGEATLLNRYLDEYVLADELGFNIMVNEHHAAATCMSTSCMTTLAILARQTRKARLLALGIPIANRSNPMRVAEEIAMVDVISGGRLEVGMVKGAAYEVFMSNRLPARFNERFWEAHELIIEALRNTWRQLLVGQRELSLSRGELVAASAAAADAADLDDVLQRVQLDRSCQAGLHLRDVPLGRGGALGVRRLSQGVSRSSRSARAPTSGSRISESWRWPAIARRRSSAPST